MSAAGGPPDANGPDIAEVYDHLRALASRHLGRAAGHTLQPTAVVHEAWLKIEASDGARFESRAHYLAVAAKAMRQILIDHARRKQAARRGGGLRALTLDERIAPGKTDKDRTVDILALEDALEELTRLKPRHAAQVELRFFGGLTTPEAASVLGISLSSAEKDWAMARAWLFRRLGAEA